MAAAGRYPAPARTPTAAEHQMVVAAVLMPRTWMPSRPWLNVLAAAVIAALLALSALLTVTTIAPHIPLVPAVTGLAAAIAVVAAYAAVIAIRSPKAPTPPGPADLLNWTMPPIESLRPPARSAWRTPSLVVLRCYLLAAVVVLAVRAIQLALETG